MTYIELDKSIIALDDDGDSPQVGDLAALKSGGPLMTVKKLSETETQCIWFDDESMGYDGYTFSNGLLNFYRIAEESE